MLVYSLRACILTLAYHACILTLAYFDTGILRTWMLSLVQCVCVCKCKCRSVSVQRIFRKNPSQCFREKCISYITTRSKITKNHLQNNLQNLASVHPKHHLTSSTYGFLRPPPPDPLLTHFDRQTQLSWHLLRRLAFVLPGHHHKMTGTTSQHDRDRTPSKHDRDTITT